MVNVKPNMNSGNMAKVACIKHFNSSNSMKSQQQQQSQQQQLIMSPNQAAAMMSLNYAPPLATQSSLSSLAAQNNNGKQIITYYSLSSLNQQQQQHHPHFENQRDHPVLKTTTTSATITNSLSFKQLNVNDLYAILKPVIKPHIHNPILESYVDSSRASSNNKHALLAADVIYLGSIYVPYDTLSNASKLNSIRSSIEYFTKSAGSFSHFDQPTPIPPHSSAGSWVNLKIFSDRIKLSNRVS